MQKASENRWNENFKLFDICHACLCCSAVGVGSGVAHCLGNKTLPAWELCECLRIWFRRRSTAIPGRRQRLDELHQPWAQISLWRIPQSYTRACGLQFYRKHRRLSLQRVGDKGCPPFARQGSDENSQEYAGVETWPVGRWGCACKMHNSDCLPSITRPQIFFILNSATL